MSRYDYQESLKVASQGYQFKALVMAAMRQADTNNSLRLEAAFPEIWEELHARYNAPGGYLEGEITPTLERPASMGG